MANIREAEAGSFTANVTLVTTAETVLLTAPAITPPYDATQILIMAWAQLTTGVATTTVTPRIRRGTAITDPVVGEANAENVKAAAGSTEPFMIMVVETLGARAQVQYSFTLQQAAATGNGTALQGAILVIAF